MLSGSIHDGGLWGVLYHDPQCRLIQLALRLSQMEDGGDFPRQPKRGSQLGRPISSLKLGRSGTWRLCWRLRIVHSSSSSFPATMSTCCSFLSLSAMPSHSLKFMEQLPQPDSKTSNSTPGTHHQTAFISSGHSQRLLTPLVSSRPTNRIHLPASNWRSASQILIFWNPSSTLRK